MLRKLGQFLAGKIEKKTAFKKGLRVAQAISFFKKMIKEDFDLKKTEIEELEFDYKEEYLVIQSKNRMLLQEIKLNSSSYLEKINSDLGVNLITGIRSKRKRK